MLPGFRQALEAHSAHEVNPEKRAAPTNHKSEVRGLSEGGSLMARYTQAPHILHLWSTQGGRNEEVFRS